MPVSTKTYVHTVLQTLGLTGFDATFVQAPNAVMAVGKVLQSADDTYDSKESANVYRNLKRNGFVTITQNVPNEYQLSLTPAGAQKLMQLNIESINIPPMSAWDGLWRLVSYDIPVSKNADRVALKLQLRRMGFVMTQKSMWVHPYDCYDQIREITDYLGVSKYVTVIEVAKFDTFTANKLERHFMVAGTP